MTAQQSTVLAQRGRRPRGQHPKAQIDVSEALALEVRGLSLDTDRPTISGQQG